MSVCTIQLGQCGNQLGQQLFSTLTDEIRDAPEHVQNEVVETFFRADAKKETPAARAVMVDMEPKVTRVRLAEQPLTVRLVYPGRGRVQCSCRTFRVLAL